MNKKYLVLEHYEVDDKKDYNSMFETEQEAIDKCNDKFGEGSRGDLYVVMVVKKVSIPKVPVETTVEEV